uniref:Uncharacterized protein n=1 Tax=Nelumbo nucifera TaxID=4432 RepID=A0A822XZG7_NELNU|nr:TPA_asm: hypothetical protein HUJ06_026896 [Nelumbo nucifera]
MERCTLHMQLIYLQEFWDKIHNPTGTRDS